MSSADASGDSMVTEDTAESTTESSTNQGHGKASYDDINMPVILTVGFVSSVLTFFCIVGVQALFYHYQRAELTNKIQSTGLALPQKQIIDEQQAKLQTYGHTVEQIEIDSVKQDRTRITIPIEEAFDLTLAEQLEAQQTAFPSNEEE